MADGLRITLSPHPHGLTVDTDGRPLLTNPKPGFVFQCPPMDEFKIVHQFNMGTYDTILNGQFAQWGSRQLATWQFDTLAMYLSSQARVQQILPPGFRNPRELVQGGVGPLSGTRDVRPSWVPFPNPELPNQRLMPHAKYTPEWYRNQLWKLHDSGAPFRYVAAFNGANIGPVLRTWAVLTGFSEDYKAGEGDCIYFEGVAFSEWRDPTLRKRGQKRKHGTAKLPTTVELRRVQPTNPVTYGVFSKTGKRIPEHGPPTLAKLAKHFYGDPQGWKDIARANSVRGGSANTPLENLSPFNKARITFATGRRIKIPALTATIHVEKRLP